MMKKGKRALEATTGDTKQQRAISYIARGGTQAMETETTTSADHEPGITCISGNEHETASWHNGMKPNKVPSGGISIATCTSTFLLREHGQLGPRASIRHVYTGPA